MSKLRLKKPAPIYSCKFYYNCMNEAIIRNWPCDRIEARRQHGTSNSFDTEEEAKRFDFYVGNQHVIFIRHPNPNNKAFDGWFKFDDGSKQRASFRQLTKKVAFQLSSYIGVSRDCTDDEFKECLKISPFQCVVDTGSAWEWTYWLIDSRHLWKEIVAGNLDKNGWSRIAFYAFLDKLRRNGVKFKSGRIFTVDDPFQS